MTLLQNTVTTTQIPIKLMVSEISVRWLLFFAFSVKDNGAYVAIGKKAP